MKQKYVIAAFAVNLLFFMSTNAAADKNDQAKKAESSKFILINGTMYEVISKKQVEAAEY